MSRACQSLASSVIRVCARHPAAASARRVSVLASQVTWAPHVPASFCFQRRMASSKVEEGEAEALFGTVGNAKTITLNRPKALNALSMNMVRLIRPQVDEWCSAAPDITSTAVITKGAGEKAFCAGGDVRSIAEAGQKGGSLTADFFREEYELDYRLATMGVPHVALMDGITMGGGVGLTVHGSFRVATERTVFAMPETAIGFFPDVGGGYFLPRLDGELGTFLALTGHRLKGPAVLYSGIATDYVKSEDLPALEAALGELSTYDNDSIAGVLRKFAADPGELPALFTPEQRRVIDACFGFNTVNEILEALEADGSELATKAAKTMLNMSPTSLVVSLQQLRQGATLDLGEVLKMEYRISQVMMQRKDFYEGIRAVLVDRDNAPVWGSTDHIAPYFASLGDLELQLPAKVADPAVNAGLVSQVEVEAALKSGADVTESLGPRATKPGNDKKLAALMELLA